MKPDLKLQLPESEDANHPLYHSAIGSLSFLANSTRPNISFAVNHLSHFSHKNDSGHWEAIIRIFQYLQGTKNLSLCYYRSTVSPSLNIEGFSDANWDGLPADKGFSTTGYVLEVSKGIVMWTSKRQSTIALSTTESESTALCSTATA